MGFIGHAPLICIVGCLFDSGVYKNSSCHTEKSIFSAPRLLSDHLSTCCRTPTRFNTSCIRFWILAMSPTVPYRYSHGTGLGPPRGREGAGQVLCGAGTGGAAGWDGTAGTTGTLGTEGMAAPLPSTERLGEPGLSSAPAKRVCLELVTRARAAEHATCSRPAFIPEDKMSK